MANDAQVSRLAGGGVVITGASSGIGKECALYLINAVTGCSPTCAKQPTVRL
jgi:NAD(P)-dependent dehydrogenase (short-subunit alcohol dehydrogenase family)